MINWIKKRLGITKKSDRVEEDRKVVVITGYTDQPDIDMFTKFKKGAQDNLVPVIYDTKKYACRKKVRITLEVLEK